MTVRITIPGDPVGKGRPRFTTQGRAYTPSGTIAAEARVSAHGQEAMQGREPWPLGTPLAVEVVAAFRPPASWSGKRKREALAGLHRPTGRPDSDNILKLVGDALEGVVWANDTQIVEATVRKVYAESPSITVTVSLARPVEAPSKINANPNPELFA